MHSTYPVDWNDRDDLTLVVRIEPAGVTNALGADLWYTKRFQDAQVKLQQRTAMLIGALMLLTVYALAAAQAGRVPYLLVFAFWLVSRCGFVMSAGGFSYFSFGPLQVRTSPWRFARSCCCPFPAPPRCSCGRSPRRNCKEPWLAS